MKTSDLTLRVLDRLPPEEARELESKLADDPQLAAELRATEDTLAAIWHAASPLVPAPAESYEGIQARLHPIRNQHFKSKIVTYGGWAAALAMVAVLVNRPAAVRPDSAQNSPGVAVSVEEFPVLGFDKDVAANELPTRRRNDDAQRKLRETVLAMQQELRALRSGSTGPKIRALRSPSAKVSAAVDPRLALRDLLTAALTEDLARRTEIPTTLTVENGWTPEAFAALPLGSVVRHRSFPVEDFSDYGLLRDANGDFYDPATQLLWTPAEDGGGYLGSRAPATQDLTEFKSPPPDLDPGKSPRVSPERPAEAEPVDIAPIEKPAASGYLVQGAGDEKTTLIIGNLPTTDPSAQWIASVDGGATLVPLTDGVIVPGPDGTGFASFSLPNPFSHSTSFGGASGVSVGFDLRELTILQNNSAGTSTVILTTDPAAGEP